jgi:methionine-rich copper-binding protein CopC
MSSFQHKCLVPLVAGAFAVITGLAGCAGNGDGLNSKGLPIGSSGGGGSTPPTTGPFTADFQSIQDNVFTPICSPCHSGASAPEGLMLDAAHSYNLLVGVPSTEVPTLDRVKAGDPVNSYIIIKLTNGAGIVGRQMPLGENPLPQATIDVIRQWITNGAPPATAAATSSVNAMAKIQALAQSTPSAPFSVTQTSPLAAAHMETPVNHIVVAFNHEVDASLVNYTTLTVERVETESAVASAAGATQATPLPAYAALAEGNPNAIVITPVAPLLPGTYRVTVRGSGGGALADLNAQVLGSDYSFTFNVDASP